MKIVSLIILLILCISLFGSTTYSRCRTRTCPTPTPMATPTPIPTPTPRPTPIPTPMPIPTFPPIVCPEQPIIHLPTPQTLCTVPPPLVTREIWNARPQQWDEPNTCPTKLVVHHTAVLQNPFQSIETKMRGIQNYHIDVKGWSDFAYHFYIDMHGEIGEGREITEAPNMGLPDDSDIELTELIIIALDGDFTQELPTVSQMESLNYLLCWLANEYQIPIEEMYGHNEVKPATLCPGIITDLMPDIRLDVDDLLNQ